MLRKYCLGLAFDNEGNLALIRKTKPDFQAGKLNFIGGKYENDLDKGSMDNCMSREFREETGVYIPPNKWKFVGRMYRKRDFLVSIYTVVDKEVSNVKTTTEEQVYLIPFEQFEISSKIAEQLMPNLKVIYEFVKSDDFIFEDARLNIEFPIRMPKLLEFKPSDKE